MELSQRHLDQFQQLLWPLVSRRADVRGGPTAALRLRGASNLLGHVSNLWNAEKAPRHVKAIPVVVFDTLGACAYDIERNDRGTQDCLIGVKEDADQMVERVSIEVSVAAKSACMEGNTT